MSPLPRTSSQTLRAGSLQSLRFARIGTFGAAARRGLGTPNNKRLESTVDGRMRRNHMRAIAGTLMGGVLTYRFNFLREKKVQTHGFQAAS
jgi:hypothetical protein